MRRKNDKWWQGIPWGWVAASAYCTALVCVGVSEVTGADAALTVLLDYQTLIASLAAIVALFIAMQQLKRQANRDAVDAIRHYQTEIDALTDMARLAKGLQRRASDHYSYWDQIPADQPRWERFKSEVHISLNQPISYVMQAIAAYNRLLDREGMPFLMLGSFDEPQRREALIGLGHACKHLLGEIDTRQKVLLRKIETES